MEWDACWGGPGRVVRTPGSFQSGAFVLELGASKSVCMLFKSEVSVSYSPLVSPPGFQTI